MKRAGIIGLGGMGTWHVSSINKSGCAQVVAAYDTNPEKLEACGKLGIKRCDTLGELFDQELDFVVIATPNNFHRELAISSLEAGINVLSEKPVAMNEREARDMVEAGKRTGKLFSVHHNRRWDRDYRMIKKIYDEKLLGEPIFIENRLHGSSGVPGDWRTVKANGGGELLDWGVHLIDQFLFMIDAPVVEAYAQVLKARTEEIDDCFKLMMKFGNGVNALVEVNTYSFVKNQPRWQFCGTGGTAVVEDWDCNGYIRKANLKEIVYDPGFKYNTGSGPTKTMIPRPVETIDEQPLPQNVDSDNLNLYRNFCAAIDGKAELIVKPEGVLRVIKLIDTLFDCAERGVSFKGEI